MPAGSDASAWRSGASRFVPRPSAPAVRPIFAAVSPGASGRGVRANGITSTGLLPRASAICSRSAASRAMSASEMLADVSTSTATATLWLWNDTAGLAIARMTATTTPAFNKRWAWRACRCHSQATQARGKSSKNSAQDRSKLMPLPQSRFQDSQARRRIPSINEPFADQQRRAQRREERPQIAGAPDGFVKRGNAFSDRRRRRPLLHPTSPAASANKRVRNFRR